MDSGKLDRQVTLQFKTPGKSASGEPTEAWGQNAVVYARVQPLSGREYWAAVAAQIVAEEMLVFTIWFRADVRPGTAQILYQVSGGPVRTYNIRRVVEIGRREFLECYADCKTA